VLGAMMALYISVAMWSKSLSKPEFVRPCLSPAIPSTSGEFQHYRTFQTHNLDVLLHLAGVERKVKTTLFAEWSAVATWDPEVRYKPIGSATKQDAELMIAAARSLLRAL
jgi:hypothetical protein